MNQQRGFTLLEMMLALGSITRRCRRREPK
ncbi:prepilin-type N-terminal cleavage/methylation domain-containing protein [Escherichia coli]